MADKTDSGMTERDILLFAMDMEREACAHYEKVAQMVDDPKARGLLIGLSSEERGHELKLKFMMEKIEADDFAAIKESPPTFHTPQQIDEKTPITHDSTVAQIILHAMEREKLAIEVYETFANLVSAGAFKELFGRLANEERGHLDEFEDLYYHELENK